MRIKIFTRLLLVVVLSVFFCTIVGAVATWRFSELPAVGMGNDFNVTLNVFDFKPSEILPSDKEDTQLHSNQYNLIESIVNHKDYGLNATKKPIVRELLEDGAGVVYGNQNVQGGNLKHLMIDGTYAYGLLFQIEYVSETEYITYTYVGSDVKLAKLESEIVVYKTIMRKGDNKKWTAPVSYYGKAPVVSVKTQNATLRAIDSSRWHDA